MRRAFAVVLVAIAGLAMLAVLVVLSLMPAEAAEPAPTDEAAQYYVVSADDLQRIALLVQVQREEIAKLKARLGNAKEFI